VEEQEVPVEKEAIEEPKQEEVEKAEGAVEEQLSNLKSYGLGSSC
jgi:hypothetical protein